VSGRAKAHAPVVGSGISPSTRPGTTSPRLERLAGQLGQESKLRASNIGFYKFRKGDRRALALAGNPVKSKRAATYPKLKRTLGALKLVSWSSMSFCLLRWVGLLGFARYGIVALVHAFTHR
jgi:hypothetical protein